MTSPAQVVNHANTPQGPYNTVAGGMGSSGAQGGPGHLATATQAAQQYQPHKWRISTLKTHWVFNGIPCTITEFADLVYKDTPQRTWFLLQYSEENL